MTYGSFYEITNPLTTVTGTRFVEWVGGQGQIPDRWKRHDVAGSGNAWADQWGLHIETGSGSSNNTQLDFGNDARHFNPVGAKTIGIIRKITAENVFIDGGFKDGYGDDNNQMSFCHIEEYSSLDGIYLMTGASSSSSTNTGVAEDEHFHQYEIELTASNNNMKLDGTLVATKTDNLPTTKTQPAFKILTRTSAAASGIIQYCEAWNT